MHLTTVNANIQRCSNSKWEKIVLLGVFQPDHDEFLEGASLDYPSPVFICFSLVMEPNTFCWDMSRTAVCASIAYETEGLLMKGVSRLFGHSGQDVLQEPGIPNGQSPRG